MSKKSVLANMTQKDIKRVFYKTDVYFYTDQNDKKLIKKLKSFKNQCEKREFIEWKQKKSYGVSFTPEWDNERGFTFDISSSEPYTFQETGYHNFDSLIAGEKKQIEFIKKARHSLACLIRLKNKMQIPGPIQELRNLPAGENVLSVYVPLTQEEIDDILKY